MAQAKLELLLELKNRLKSGLAAAKNSVFTSMKDMKSKLSDFTASNMQAFKSIADQIPGVGSALSLLANPYALAAAAALSFGAAAAKATNMALDWEKSMAKVNVTAQLGKSELGSLSTQLRFVGSQMTGDFMQVPEAFNRIISAGLNVEQSMAALVPTLKAAKAGFTDIETVAAAGIGVMKSSGENINVVYDTLFATLNKGNAEFKDIAQYLPKVIPGARLAGAELYETAGAFAFLTAQGQTAEQSTTGLMNAFKALSDPRFTQGFKEIGVDVFDMKGSFRGILPIVTDLQKRMQGLTDEQAGLLIKTIGLDQEARMAFGTMIQNVDELKSTLDFVKNSTGQLEEAVKNSATSTGGWALGWNKVRFLAIEFGNLFLPIVDAIGNGFDYAMQQTQALFIASKATFSGLIAAAKEFAKILMPIAEAMVNWRDPKAMVSALSKIPGSWDSMDVSGAFDKEFKRVIKENSMPGVADAGTPITTTPGSLESDFEGSAAGSTSASAPSAHQSKSIVINIEAIHKGDNKISQNTEGMSLEQFRRMMDEAMLQMIRNVEASY